MLLNFISHGALALFFVGVAQAQLTQPQPYLQALDPMVLSPGKEQSLQFAGSNLENASAVILRSESGKALHKIGIEAAKGAKGRWTLRVGAEVPDGWYDLRVLNAHGVSNPRALLVSRRPLHVSSGGNDQVTKAEALPSDVTLCGQFKAGAAQWFALDLKKGARLQGLFCQGANDSRCRLMGLLQDPQGRVVARVREGGLDAKVLADGRHLLKLHDMMFGGGVDYSFVFELGTGPRIWAQSDQAVVGWSLPGGIELKGLDVGRGGPPQWLPLSGAPAEVAALAKAVRCMGQGRLPRGLQPPGAEVQVKLSKAPVEAAGWFPAAGRADVYELPVAKGQRLSVDLISHGLGFASDASLIAEWLGQDDKAAASLAGEGLDAGAVQPAPSTRWQGLDPSLVLVAPAAGRLRLSVSDPGNSANGRRLPYALRVSSVAEWSQWDWSRSLAFHSHPAPAVATAAQIGSPNLLRNGQGIVEVLLPGRHAGSPAVDLQCGLLGDDGVKLRGRVGAGKSLGYLEIPSSLSAAPGALALREPGRLQTLVWPVADTAREAAVYRLANGPVLGVSEQEVPVRLELSSNTNSLKAASAVLSLKVKLTRHADFKEALKLKVLGLHDAAKAPEISVAPNASEAQLNVDLKALKLAAGVHVVFLQGLAKMPVRNQAAAIASTTLARDQAKAALEQAQKPVPSATGNAAAAKGTPNLKSLQASLAAEESKLNALLKANPAKDQVLLVHSPLLHFEIQ